MEWIATQFNIGIDSAIADFGCGPGLYTTRLAKLGAKMTGIDFSERSIAYAKEISTREQLNISYVNQNYLTYETKDRFDLVLMIMCDFCALSPAQREKLLTKFHEILKPGCSVLLDVYSLPAFEQRQENATYEVNQLHGFWSPKKYYGFVNTFKYEDEKVVLDKYTIIEPGRTRQVFNWLQYFAPEDIEREFTASGLAVKEYYADIAGKPYDPKSSEFAVIARKE